MAETVRCNRLDRLNDDWKHRTNSPIIPSFMFFFLSRTGIEFDLSDLE